MKRPYNLAYFVLNVPRELLYKRIDDRVDEMLEEGLLEEVEQLKKRGCHQRYGFHAGTGVQGNPSISGGRISSGGSSPGSEKRYQTFCQASADLVSERKG